MGQDFYMLVQYEILQNVSFQKVSRKPRSHIHIDVIDALSSPPDVSHLYRVQHFREIITHSGYESRFVILIDPNDVQSFLHAGSAYFVDLFLDGNRCEFILFTASPCVDEYRFLVLHSSLLKTKICRFVGNPRTYPDTFRLGK